MLRVPLLVALAASAAAVWFVSAHGRLLYYGDAESHLNIARRLFDASNPGLEQLGIPWLPLPHLLIAPFAAIRALWMNGLAGSIAPAACFIGACLFLFAAVREVFSSIWPAWTAMLIMLLNPNTLYLQSIPMTEPVFAAALCGLLFFTVRYRRTLRLPDAAGAGLCALCGTLTRYEAWFLLPFCCLYFLFAGKRGFRAAVVFGLIAATGPLLWLAYNWWCTGNALYFWNGPGSAKAIQGNASYPGMHDWSIAWLYYRTCVRLVIGKPLFWLLFPGLAVALFRRAWWPALLLALPPVFYVWSMHSSSGTPIFMPELWPHSWYNTRYGLAALPLAAYCGAAITRSRWSLAIAALALIPWVWRPSGDQVITWKESQVNSESRRAWTRQSADFLRHERQDGDIVTADFDDTIGIFRYAGIDLKEVFHPGDTLAWDAAVQRPDLFLHTAWVLCQRRDSGPLHRAMAKAIHYQLVKTIIVPGYDPPIDIYKHADPFYQVPRRGQ